EIGDDLLRLMFIACHPSLSQDSRVALTLRLLGGLTTDEIARAFLVPEATIAQRIVRAKRALAQGRVAYEVPRRDELDARVPAVLGVIYLVFNEGYSATAGEDLLRPDLCAEALRLGRVLAGLLPRHAEAHGLLALMELQSSRARARVTPEGEPVLLAGQDRSLWDRGAIARGLAALERARCRHSPARTRCRRRSRPAMPARRPPRKPTGRGSSRSTTRSCRPCPRRWSSSTALSRSRCTPARPPRCRWSRPCARCRRCAITTCCPRCAATCWKSSAAAPRRARNSSAPRA